MELKSTLTLDGAVSSVKKKVRNRHFFRRVEQPSTGVTTISLDTLPDWAGSIMYKNETGLSSGLVITYPSGAESHTVAAGNGVDIPLHQDEAPTAISIVPQDSGTHTLVMY